MKRLLLLAALLSLVAAMALPASGMTASTLEGNLNILESYIENPRSVSQENAYRALRWIREYIGESEEFLVLNTSSKKFHRPTCRYAEQLQDERRVEYNGSREELIEKGYDPCKVCNP